jgi:hypothetical protein
MPAPKFNLGVYKKLTKDDANAYASSFETSNKKSALQSSFKKTLKSRKTKGQARLKSWEDRNLINRGTKLNP